MNALRAIPELAALRSSRRLVRIPPETDVPLTPRVARLVDAPAFRRLSGISQLGLVALVYPGATHTRFEHSLGVYRMALLFLDRLAEDDAFARAVSPEAAEAFLAAALLHDVGHWPFCHPIEDLGLAEVPRHEATAEQLLAAGELAEALADDWALGTAQLARLLTGDVETPAERLLVSLLSGPIDVDKMDYLARDSLHAGVPYGRNFDSSRLIHSLCLSEKGDRLAITDKGKTAAEMMVFARYVMFSEVYWHHAVRSATAMLQRAFYLLGGAIDMSDFYGLREAAWVAAVRAAAAENSPPAGRLLDGLFGEARVLYKRVGQYSLYQQRDVYQLLARRPYPWLCDLSAEVARRLSHATSHEIAAEELLIDAPPAKLEVQFEIDVYYSKEQCYRPLRDVSPVVRTLAEQQFDDYVKRVRLFAHPRVAQELSDPEAVRIVLKEAVAAVGG